MKERESRSYIRDNCFYSDANVISDGVKQSVAVTDLSAGGVKFIVEIGEGGQVYKLDDKALFCLVVKEFAAEMEIKADIIIKRAERGHHKGEYIYGASFDNLTLEQSIQLDEIILYKKRRAGFLPEE